MPDEDAHRILVVDDEPLNRELLRRVLSRHYQIDEAEDAEQAMEILEDRHERIDLILCDQLMPGKNGTDLARDARAKWPELVFVLLTGYDDDQEVTGARASGLVAHVVSKPWRGSTLRQLIEKAIAAI